MEKEKEDSSSTQSSQTVSNSSQASSTQFFLQPGFNPLFGHQHWVYGTARNRRRTIDFAGAKIHSRKGLWLVAHFAIDFTMGDVSVYFPKCYTSRQKRVKRGSARHAKRKWNLRRIWLLSCTETKIMEECNNKRKGRDELANLFENGNFEVAAKFAASTPALQTLQTMERFVVPGKGLIYISELKKKQCL